jgi:hypothetical protein
MECVLTRNHVGRVAFLADARVEVRPVHYVYADGAIFGRTSYGMKYLSWLLRSDVVFEVDEVEGLLDWRSIVLRGTLSMLRPRGPSGEAFNYWNAVAAIRTVVPAAFTQRDPVPYRGAVFRIQPSEMTGRESRSP